VTDPTTCATFKVLDLFRLLNVVGNVNCHDFINALERLTDATSRTGMAWMPVRLLTVERDSAKGVFLGSLQTVCQDAAAICVFAKGETRGSGS
jgi:hypothetical protein